MYTMYVYSYSLGHSQVEDYQLMLTSEYACDVNGSPPSSSNHYMTKRDLRVTGIDQFLLNSSPIQFS